MKDFRLNESSRGDILKQCDLCFQALANCINQSIVSGTFPDSLKLANISPVYKAKDPLDKTNSNLPVPYLYCQRYTKDYVLTEF